MLSKLSATLFLAAVTRAMRVAIGSDIAVCPGEGDRYGDHKCNHDETHRVCAQLIDGETGSPLVWGEEDFWAITD